MKNDLRLTSESVQGSALAFQGVHDVHGGDSLPLCVFSVCNRVSDDILQKDLEDSSGFFVDQTADTFNSTSTSQSTDGGLRDTLDVIT